MQLELFELFLKRCSSCTERKPLDEFNRRRGARDGRQSYCRACNAAWHARNRDRHNRMVHERTARVREQLRRLMAEFLADKSCADCGESDLRVLEFDHLRDKTTNVSALMRGGNWARVLAEIEKCEIVCANCHRRRTHERAGTYRVRMRPAPPTLSSPPTGV